MPRNLKTTSPNAAVDLHPHPRLIPMHMGNALATCPSAQW